MALAGTLKDFSLADIFQLISFQRKTGILSLKAKDSTTVTVSVVNGTIVSADSLPKRPDDHLGQVLVKKGLITSEQLEKALHIQAETMQKMGYILTHQNFVTTEALREALGTQISQIIFRLFRWSDGNYEFAQADSVEYDREFIAPIQIENVLMEGMRMLDEWPIISKKIPDFNVQFMPEIHQGDYVLEGTEEIDFGEEPGAAEKASGKVKLSANEHHVFQLVDGIRDVQAITERSRLTEFETCRALYDLLSRNLISEAARQKPARAATPGALGVVRKVEAVDASPVLTWILALLAAASFLLMIARPFGFLYYMRPKGMDLSAADEAARFVEMSRIAEKVRVYYLHTHTYPTSLVILQEADLLDAAQIIDPNGKQKYDLVTENGVLCLRERDGGPRPSSILIESPPSPPASTTQPPDESLPNP